MKKRSKILILLMLCLGFASRTYCQENQRELKTIKLKRGCNIVLDTSIDATDKIAIEIEEGIRTVMPGIQELIPVDSVTISLAISSVYILPVWGMGGRTIGDDNGETIELYYDPDHPNFKVEYIFRSLVHEMHHAARIRNPDYELTLLECMVNEGLAEHFMIEVLRCEPSPWDTALTKEQMQQCMSRVKPLLRIKHESWTSDFSENYFNPWMFGKDGDNPIPHWTGYSIGWKLVENYLIEHPGTSASSLVWTDAETIASSTPELLNENNFSQP